MCASGIGITKNRFVFWYYLLAALLAVSAAIAVTNHQASVTNETAVQPCWAVPDLGLHPVVAATTWAVVPSDTFSVGVCCDMAVGKKEDIPSIMDILIKLLMRLFS